MSRKMFAQILILLVSMMYTEMFLSSEARRIGARNNIATKVDEVLDDQDVIDSRAYRLQEDDDDDDPRAYRLQEDDDDDDPRAYRLQEDDDDDDPTAYRLQEDDDDDDLTANRLQEDDDDEDPTAYRLQEDGDDDDDPTTYKLQEDDEDDDPRAYRLQEDDEDDDPTDNDDKKSYRLGHSNGEDDSDDDDDDDEVRMSTLKVAGDHDISANIQWQNRYDHGLRVQCHNGHYFYGVQSHFSNGHGDRVWRWKCRRLAHRWNHCYWTGYLNNWGQVINFNCRRNYVIAGTISYHRNNGEDRRWRFLCCRTNGYITYQCRMTGKINNFHHHMNFNLGAPYGFTGVYSCQSHRRRDRIWKVRYCKYVKKSPCD